MQWPKFSLLMGALVAFVGLVADFRDAATEIGSHLPWLKGLLPIIGLGGATCVLVMIAVHVAKPVTTTIRAARAKSPDARLRRMASFLELLRKSLSQYVSSYTYHFDSEKRHDLIAQLVAITHELEEELGIPCPKGIRSEETESDSINQWIAFLVNLVPLARHGKIQEARRLMGG